MHQTQMPPVGPDTMRPAPGYQSMVQGQGQGMGPAGPGAVGPPMAGGMTPGMGQMATLGIRLAMEIDMNLKQLAQIAPVMAPWVMRVGEEMKLQLAQAMSTGGVPSTPAGGSAQWPDGSGRL